ncbi:dihydroxyacetone kinase phosphoryl donor subunit DhaM [Actinomadura parmotrematis]|uniref:phosphoenolpyruvate--glycerone phosphotransferase n=1 Tax=Actinomadura parmotrematis TaxID=2864039 RepID=A0ABS7G2K0_9ACTN|nr:dihydroxyacetone kinase phosphoryl donor subunit DhaM [Actinomadura parmotrematis]MBW8486951.1 phosphoenolpyruvate--protein phosphotransferase [Actinomadura parmotrematis]
MIGIVLVSHSRALAEGAAELARTLGGGRAVVHAAGGDADGGLGTSPELVEAAIAAADDGDGVVLLADLGSSVLTCKLAAEDAAGRVALADAPFVEGAVAAASLAAAGADLAAVRAAAEDARNHRKIS